MAGVGDEGIGVVAKEEDFFDAVAVGAFEDDFVVGLAREEGFELPEEAVPKVDLAEVLHGLHLFGDGPADGGAEHGFEVDVEAGFRRVEGIFEGVFDKGAEGIGKGGIGSGVLDFFESGEALLGGWGGVGFFLEDGRGRWAGGGWGSLGLKAWEGEKGAGKGGGDRVIVQRLGGGVWDGIRGGEWGEGDGRWDFR